MYIYMNGQVIPKEEAKISPFDHGFLYGLGVFETFRTYDGHPFLLDDHLDRLQKGLQQLQIELSIQRTDVAQMLKELYEKNGWKNAYCRLNVSAGNGEIGLQVSPYTCPNVILFQKPLPPIGASSEKSIQFLQLRRNTPETNERLKSHHYLNNVAAKREIGEQASVEGVFLTEQGWVAEGIVSNVFWVKDDIVYTPAIETGILNGVTRQLVLRILRKAAIDVVEGLFTKEALLDADEIFLTNSIQEVVPVHRCEDRDLPGRTGKITLFLSNEYRKYTHFLWSQREL
ncbi:MAG: aminodeoxychorismate lyase [Bacillus sp. (in: Bacteria)]|jgi:4-amino-4-deoxychorismate lyase|nr:aminodeoxychorismate lyase [Bacillus sp. (in: firmicutes)]